MELLKLEKINSYYGRSHILFDVDLEIMKGETVAILGRNGSGRTTTLKTIMGMIKPAPGKIFFTGKDITGLSPFQIARKGIAFVPEERRVFTALTVGDNLEVAGKCGKKGYWNLERILKTFYMLHPLLKRKGGHLSGGEQQMVAIARGLIQNPDLLILDEPTEGLAPGIVKDAFSVIREIKSKGESAILLVEQDVRAMLALSDRVYVLGEGRTVFRGRPEELESMESLKKEHLGV